MTQDILKVGNGDYTRYNWAQSWAAACLSCCSKTAGLS